MVRNAHLFFHFSLVGNTPAGKHMHTHFWWRWQWCMAYEYYVAHAWRYTINPRTIDGYLSTKRVNLIRFNDGLSCRCHWYVVRAHGNCPMPMSISMHRLGHRINRRFLFYLFFLAQTITVSFVLRQRTHNNNFPFGPIRACSMHSNWSSLWRSPLVCANATGTFYFDFFFSVSHLLSRHSHRRPGKRKPKRILCVFPT